MLLKRASEREAPQRGHWGAVGISGLKSPCERAELEPSKPHPAQDALLGWPGRSLELLQTWASQWEWSVHLPWPWSPVIVYWELIARCSSISSHWNHLSFPRAEPVTRLPVDMEGRHHTCVLVVTLCAAVTAGRLGALLVSPKAYRIHLYIIVVWKWREATKNQFNH